MPCPTPSTQRIPDADTVSEERLTIIDATPVPPGAAPGLGADDLQPEHQFSRRGAQLRVRVHPIDDPDNGGYLLVFGDLGPAPLVRVHSRCLYGDALGSDDCDCGPELALSMDMIQAEGAGVLAYLEQEGRGAGLVLKAIGYRTSERYDLDTFDSYAKLGLDPDARRYEPVAKALLNIGVHRLRLLTNNPDKLQALAEAGIEVEVLPLAVRLTSERGQRYLDAKVRQRGHMIPREVGPWAPEYTARAEHVTEERPRTRRRWLFGRRR
ncbi:GTP cyclohydrolase II [Nocardia sp. NPDC050717]|uniref:GTP cyclohydrolase II n=1 Tax=Nocardia sp. NPDC050717 TaxID=3157221 RepID=UPI0033F1C9FB